MSDDEEVDTGSCHDDDGPQLDDIRVGLKPRCNLGGTIKELRRNDRIGHLSFDVYRQWFKDAAAEDVDALFDAIGKCHCKSLSFENKGSGTQHLPLKLLTPTLREATSTLEEFHSTHIKWKGSVGEWDELAAVFADSVSLKVLDIHVEALDDGWDKCLAAAGQVAILESVIMETAQAASHKDVITPALQALCTSKSLKSLQLLNVTVKFEPLTSMARLLCSNSILEELVIQARELDVAGGMAMAQMLTANQGLQKFVLKLDKMHSNRIGEAFIQALQTNAFMKYFQIILDGRQSDMIVVREMQVRFRDLLADHNYTVKPQSGLFMGVTVERNN